MVGDQGEVRPSRMGTTHFVPLYKKTVKGAGSRGDNCVRATRSFGMGAILVAIRTGSSDCDGRISHHNL